jgi:hypothetical protein
MRLLRRSRTGAGSAPSTDASSCSRRSLPVIVAGGGSVTASSTGAAAYARHPEGKR